MFASSILYEEFKKSTYIFKCLRKDPLFEDFKKICSAYPESDWSLLASEFSLVAFGIDAALVAHQSQAQNFTFRSEKYTKEQVYYLSADLGALEHEGAQYLRNSRLFSPYIEFKLIEFFISHETFLYIMDVIPKTVLASFFISDRRQKAENIKSLSGLFNLVSSEVYDPSALLDLLKESTRKGCSVNPIVNVLLNRLIDQKISYVAS